MTLNFKDYSYDGKPHCYICGYTFHMVPYDWRRDPKATSLRKCDDVVLHNAEDVEDLHLFRRKAWWAVHRMSELSMVYQTTPSNKLTPHKSSVIRKSIHVISQASRFAPSCRLPWMKDMAWSRAHGGKDKLNSLWNPDFTRDDCWR